MNLVDALSGCGKLEGVQRLLRSGAPRWAVRQELSALLAAPGMLGPCHLRYARFKPGRKLTAYFDALVRSAGTKGYTPRPIAVAWGGDQDAGQYATLANPTEVQAEAMHRGLAAPFRQLMSEVPAWDMGIQISPFDARIPQLVRWSDAWYARDAIARAYATSRAAQGQAAASRYAVTSIRYRPGKRHVLRYDSLDPAAPRTLFAKLYHSDKGSRVFRVASQVAEWLASHGQGMASVQPLAHLTEDGVVLYPRVLGMPLSKLLRPVGRRVPWVLERAGAALQVLHQLPQELVGPLKVVDFTAQIREIERDTSHVLALMPSAGVAIKELLERARELHQALPQEPPTFAHRDFKCEHLLVSPGGLTLIDLDICALADPAFDVGKFLADLRWWFVTYEQPDVEQIQERFLAGYAPGAPEGRLLRARLHEAIELAKMAILRARLFEPHGASRIEQLIGRAQTVMNKLESTLGLSHKVGNRDRPVAISE